MRPLVIGVLSLLLMAMGGRRPEAPSSPNSPNVPATPAPAAIDPYYQNFKKLGVQFGAVFIADTITFAFRSFFGSTVGMCTSSSSRRNKVELSPSAFNGGSDTFKEMLVFHELGHCLLGRGHDNSTHSDGRPDSLMNSWLFDQRTYLANRDGYLKELFTVTNTSFVHAAARSAPTVHDGCEFGQAPPRDRGYRH